MEIRLGRTVEHPQHRRLGANREQHEDRKHAPRANVVAINEPQSIRDGVPHAVDRPAAPAEAREPFRERDVVEVADLRA